MRNDRWLGVSISIIAFSLMATIVSPVLATAEDDKAIQIDIVKDLQLQINQLPPLKIEQPDWYKQIKKQEQQKSQKHANVAPVSRANTSGKVVRYTVETRGVVNSNTQEFATQVHETLNDPRGWARMGIAFERVASGGDFHLVLSQASEVPRFSSGCSAELSCRVGTWVIINDTRWSNATTPWNSAGGNLRDYRHMVVNHEVGHWLGHDHVNCPRAGSPAPVMRQQSVDLQGCAFNAWPLDSEMWTTR